MLATWRPLAAWPYPARQKRNALFRSTWAATLKLLEREVIAAGGSELIIGIVVDPSEIRIDAQPRANFKVRHPGAEVSFERDGQRLSFHTDTYDVLQYNLRAIALGLEALRAVDRHGISSGTEQYAGFAQLAAGGPSADRGKVLVEQAGSIREALRRHHPDHGGRQEDFVDVQAYRTAVGL